MKQNINYFDWQENAGYENSNSGCRDIKKSAGMSKNTGNANAVSKVQKVMVMHGNVRADMDTVGDKPENPYSQGNQSMK